MRTSMLIYAWRCIRAWYRDLYDRTPETWEDSTRRQIHSAADVPPGGLTEKQTLMTVRNFLMASRRVLVVQSFMRGLSPVEETVQKLVERGIDYLACVEAFGPEEAARIIEGMVSS